MVSGFPESELHRLIRYGCLFQLELKQEQEILALRQENATYKNRLRERRKRLRRRLRELAGKAA